MRGEFGSTSEDYLSYLHLRSCDSAPPSLLSSPLVSFKSIKIIKRRLYNTLICMQQGSLPKSDQSCHFPPPWPRRPPLTQLPGLK